MVKMNHLKGCRITCRDCPFCWMVKGKYVCKFEELSTPQYTNKELYDLIKGMEKIKEINNFIPYVCIQ